MNLKRISVGNFKSLYHASFEPGKVNVFVGANGSGKSTILEAIGLLSAAMTDWVDASEGALYVLFMLCLAMHPQSPAIFAVDSFDHALNPRLAKKMIQVFCEQIIKNDKHVFLTTHNPLVLDGLDLSDENIRLFAVDRDKYGYAQIKRIKVSQELIDEGQPLSRLWINGRIGGVPELI